MIKHCCKIIIVGLLLLIVSCNTTEQIVLQTTMPSPVVISNKIKRVGIINGSLPFYKENYQSGVEQIVAFEERLIVEKGKDAAMTGLFNELLKDSRFESIKILDTVPEVLQRLEASSNAIPWSSIENLCETYGVDAIFSMAFYETDTKVSVKKTSMMQPNHMRIKVKVPGKEITLKTLIENGWKVYNPYKREVIDEIVFNDQIVSKGKGVNPVEAYRSIDDRKDLLIEHGKTSGVGYGQRLLPFTADVTRKYYVRGAESFKIANDFIVKGDWTKAKELWEGEIENTNLKIRSKSCHNLAVMSERIGDLEKALHWASLAHEYNDNKAALKYMNALKVRIEQKDTLQEQLVQLNNLPNQN